MTSRRAEDQHLHDLAWLRRVRDRIDRALRRQQGHRMAEKATSTSSTNRPWTLHPAGFVAARSTLTGKHLAAYAGITDCS